MFRDIFFRYLYRYKRMSQKKTFMLSDGYQIPVIGMGTYIRGGPKDQQMFETAVETAISCGYRHIDTATMYKNEAFVGNVLKKKFQDGTVKREDMFVTTKVWNDKHAEDEVIQSLKESLKNLQLEYVDLFLIHWPMAIKDDTIFLDTDYLETWRGIEECHRLGLTRSIGVSNFNISQLERILEHCVFRPVVNQVEVNPNNTQTKLLKFCKEQGIQVIAYSPFGSMPEAKIRFGCPPPRIDDPILTEIANKYGKTTTQVVLRFLIDSGVAVLPKSMTPSRIESNFKVFDFQLTEEERRKVGSFDKNYRIVGVPFWKEHKYFPFAMEQ